MIFKTKKLFSLLNQFKQNGFLVLSSFCTHHQCQQLINRAQQLASVFTPQQLSVFTTNQQTRKTDSYFLQSGNKISFFFQECAPSILKQNRNTLLSTLLNKIGHAQHDLDPIYNQFSRSSSLKNLSRQLCLENHIIIQSMHIFKHAKIGGQVGLHQDSTFLYTEPLSCIGFWFALQDATIQNGCMWAKPGGHKTSLRKRFQRNGKGGVQNIQLNKEPFDKQGLIPLQVKKGSLILLDGLLPHCSQANRSGKSRQAYTMHVVDKTKYYPQTNWLQRKNLEARGFFI